MPIGVAATGFAAGLSLIVAIGAQNAFILRQGLLPPELLRKAVRERFLGAAS